VASTFDAQYVPVGNCVSEPLAAGAPPRAPHAGASVPAYPLLESLASPVVPQPVALTPLLYRSLTVPHYKVSENDLGIPGEGGRGISTSGDFVLMGAADESGDEGNAFLFYRAANAHFYNPDEQPYFQGESLEMLDLADEFPTFANLTLDFTSLTAGDKFGEALLTWRAVARRFFCLEIMAH
jgi:hypothetical protein